MWDCTAKGWRRKMRERDRRKGIRSFSKRVCRRGILTEKTGYGVVKRAVVRALLLAAILVLPACATGRPRVQEPSASVPAGWPLTAQYRLISSDFGARSASNGGGQRIHQGIDIPAPKGTPVHATASGGCVVSGRNRGGYGEVIVLEHDGGYQTLYAHLSRRVVRVGQRVERGEIVGHVGSTGRATGNHLHYEVRRNAKACNPVPFLRSGDLARR